jgi:hypothetical protein
MSSENATEAQIVRQEVDGLLTPWPELAFEVIAVSAGQRRQPAPFPAEGLTAAEDDPVDGGLASQDRPRQRGQQKRVGRLG